MIKGAREQDRETKATKQKRHFIQNDYDRDRWISLFCCVSKTHLCGGETSVGFAGERWESAQPWCDESTHSQLSFYLAFACPGNTFPERHARGLPKYRRDLHTPPSPPLRRLSINHDFVMWHTVRRSIIVRFKNWLKCAAALSTKPPIEYCFRKREKKAGVPRISPRVSVSSKSPLVIKNVHVYVVRFFRFRYLIFFCRMVAGLP